MTVLAECTSHCNFIRSYVGLITDAPHLCFELTLEAITGLVLYPPARRLLRAYRERIHREIDAEHGFHHQETPDHGHE